MAHNRKRKTLTSFKASTLLKDHPNIEKCLLVVDRKDLDSQTREEFNKFQEGCAEENTNAETMVRRMLSEVYNIKGDAASVEFINCFKEVERLKTHLDQYTDLDEEQKAKIEEVMRQEQHELSTSNPRGSAPKSL